MPYYGELSALLTAVLWSFTAIAFSSAANKIGALKLNVTRLLLASVFLFLTVFIAGIDYNLSSYQVIFLIISGIVGLVIGDYFLFQSYTYLGARLGVLLLSTSPVMSSILAFIFLDEKISAWGIAGIIITIGGVFLVVSEKQPDNVKFKASPIGIFHGLMGAMGQAVGLILAKYAFSEGEINGFVATFIRVASSAIILLPLAFTVKKMNIPFKLLKEDKKITASITAGTILGPYLGITFSLIAVAHTKVGIAATLMSTMPIVMLPIARYFYKEHLSWRAIIGAFIAVAGIAILFMR